MASLWYRVNQPRVQSSVYTGQCPPPYPPSYDVYAYARDQVTVDVWKQPVYSGSRLPMVYARCVCRRKRVQRQ